MHSIKLLNALLIVIALLLGMIIGAAFLRFPAAHAQDAQLPQYDFFECYTKDEMKKELNKRVANGWRLVDFGSQGQGSNGRFGYLYYALMTK